MMDHQGQELELQAGYLDTWVIVGQVTLDKS